MEYVKFFTSLMWGAIICIPVMVLVGREVDGMAYMEDFVWVPILVAMISLTAKTVMEKKRR
jgi:hypothetical protein